MTGGQATLSLEADITAGDGGQNVKQVANYAALALPLAEASGEEQQNHVEWLARLDENVEGQCVWSRLNSKIERNQ